MHGYRPTLSFLAVTAFLLGLPGAGGALENYSSADPGAPPVTRENLLASELFWPYRVVLPEPWQPPEGDRAISAGTRGVLVRVESSDLARIDFGRYGVHQVPVERTDLIQRANRVRLGEEEKIAPNFVHAIGPRMMQSASPELSPVLFRDTFQPPGFLSVFADPGDEGFADLAAALAPLHERHGVWTVLFPQGVHRDPQVYERLRSLGWEVPFVRDFLSRGYTLSRLREGTPLPAVMIETREGRLVFESAWGTGLATKLEAALDGAFGEATAGSVPVP